jgi:hypothetical protein
MDMSPCATKRSLSRFIAYARFKRGFARFLGFGRPGLFREQFHPACGPVAVFRLLMIGGVMIAPATIMRRQVEEARNEAEDVRRTLAALQVRLKEALNELASALRRDVRSALNAVILNIRSQAQLAPAQASGLEADVVEALRRMARYGCSPRRLERRWTLANGRKGLLRTEPTSGYARRTP